MSQNFNKHLGLLIKKHREQKNFTQSALAQKLHFDTPQFISILERGLAPIPLNVLGKLIILIDLPEKKIVDLLLKEYEHTLRNEIRIGIKYQTHNSGPKNIKNSNQKSHVRAI